MKRSISFTRLVLVFCAVMLALAALAAQMAVLSELPTLAVSRPGHGVLARLSSIVESAGLDAAWEQVRARVPAALAAPSPESELHAAWQRAQEAGAYTFTADAEQALIPRPVPGMIGQTDQRVDLRLEGEVTLPDHARLKLRFEGAGLDAAPVELVQDGAETYILKNGERIPVDNPAGLSSPTADYLGYLAAAENVQQLPSPEIGGGAGGGGHFVYDINGWRFAEHVRDQFQAQLKDGATVGGQPLPPDITLSSSPLLQRMTGHGELWVDADGLPRRQVVNLEIPEVSEGYDARVRLTVDFDFGETATAQAAPSPAGAIEPSSASRSGETRSFASLKDKFLGENGFLTIPHAVSFLFCVALASALIYLRRRRYVYAAVAITVSILMVVTPLLQAAGWARFQARQAAAAPATTITEALGLPTDSTESTDHASRITDHDTWDATDYCSR